MSKTSAALSKILGASLSSKALVRFAVSIFGGYILATLVAWLFLVAAALISGGAPESAWNPLTPATHLLDAGYYAFVAMWPVVALLVVTMFFASLRSNLLPTKKPILLSITATVIAAAGFVVLVGVDASVLFLFIFLTYWLVCGLVALWIVKKAAPKLR